MLSGPFPLAFSSSERIPKALLQLLLKISESVSRLESLLLIPSPDDDKPEHLGMSSPRPPNAVMNDAENKYVSTFIPRHHLSRIPGLRLLTG